MNKSGFGVIGAGLFGENHALTYSRLPEVELIGICDIDGDRARLIADRYGVKASYTNYLDLINRPDIAAAPAVDISVRRDGPDSPGLDIYDFMNGDQAAAEVRPGEWYVAIAPAGSDMPVFGPAAVELSPYAAYLVYAVGSVDTGSFTLLLERIGGLKPMGGRMSSGK